MRKTYKRVLAMLLAAMMTAGTFMVPSASAQDSDESSYASEAMATLANTTSSPANAFTGKPFTGTADLIQDSIKYVLENGVAPSGGQEDWLAADVEAQSGMSLDAVMSGIFRGISDKENNGYMNTAIYHLDEVTMEAVMERVLSRYSLVDAVTYSLDTVDGEVIGISYELKEALSVALDEIEVNAATGNDESAIADAVERAEANAAEKFGGEANFEDGDGEQTEETPDEEIPEEEAHEHLYANPVSVQWADGYTTCTAVFTCTECTDDVEGHILTETTNNISYAEGTDTTIVAYFECNGFTAETTLEEHIHIYNPNDTETFTFSWYDYRTVNDDADGDGQPDMSMVYDPTYDPAGDPSYDPATGMGKYVMYDSSTGIGVSMVNKIVVDCGGLTIKCTGCDNTIEVAADNEGLIVDTMYLDATGQPTYDPNAIIMEMMTAAYALTPDTIFSTTLDSAEYRLKIHWSEMTHFFREHPEYYGTSAPFWTSKNTNETPLQAIKVLCNMGDLVFVPNPNMDYMVEMLTQAFIAYVMQYGYMLQYTVYDAMACLDDSMTDIQKMLVMHDWLAKNATFDMQSLIDSKSGESEGADPISFTPFGTLLANQIGTDGAICLGYAAAYNFLLQYAFPEHYMNADGEWLSPEEADHITDFVQIKFHADVAESSVAGGDSGFGEGIFNEPHYFNAVRLPDEETGIGSDYWYYVDACYDDVSVEVISQYRVETDGNISHMYFLNSPQSFIDQFEGNFDYFDSAYDGYVWQPNYVLDENGQPFMGEDGKLVTEKDEDGYTIYTQYTAEDEFMYDDDQFEQTWFSNIVSEILYDADYWYYVEGSGGSYASMKDLFGDNGFGNSNGSGNSSFGDMMDSDTMAQFTDDPANGDKLKRRGREFGDRPEEEGNTSNSFGSTSYEDPHAEVLFHYGYGSVGAPETDEEGNALNGAFYDLVVIDKAFNDKYPDLVHSVALYEKNKQLYFNLGDTILVYSLKNSRVKQLKEYNTVHAVTNGKRFTGMSFYTTNNVEDEAYTFTVKDHPIAALTINQVITWERDEQGNPLMDESGQPIRHTTPSLYVSIATNYSNSYVVDETPYIVEAVNFNPDYYRFMASDDEESEEENENVEFMWCANIVDIMPVANMLNDMNKTYVTVHEDAVCGYNGFDEPRSPTFGLSDGTEKVEIEASAIDHHFIWNDTEEMFICFRCLDCIDQTYVDENGVITGHIVTGDPVFVWADDFSSCEIHRDCDVSDCDSEEVHECTVTSEEFDDGLTTVYTATYEEDGVVYTDTKTVVVHVHQLTEEPEFVWGEDEEGNVTATIIFVCISEECDDPDYKATYTCDVEAEADPENEVIVYTATYDVYSDIKRVSTHEHVLTDEPEFVWGEDEDGNVTAKIIFVCTSANCDEEDFEDVHDCNVTFVEDTVNEEITYTAVFEGYSDTKVVAMDHKHNLTDEPEFVWVEDADGNVTATIVFVCVSEKCNVVDYKEVYDCKITSTVDEENEVIIYTATYGDYSDTKSVDNHQCAYGDPVFNWSDDAASCEAVFTCEKCGETETVTCTVDQRGVDPDTGDTTYVANCTFQGKNYSDEKVIEHTEHTYEISEFIWEDDYSGCVAVFVCTKCSDNDEASVVEVECDVDSEIVEEPTTSTVGVIRYTANCTFDGEEYTDYKDVEISALGTVDLTVSDLRIKSNQQAQMTISIDKIPENGIAYLNLEIDYDSDYLTLVSAEATNVISDSVTYSENFDDKPYYVIWDTNNTVVQTQTGVILTLTFQAGNVESFTEGMTLVTIKVNEGLDMDLNELSFNISEFKTSIVIPGDVNDDGEVNGKDLILLRRFVAEFEGVEINEAAGDVNADGKADGKDVIVMRQYLAKWDGVVLQ